MKFALGNVGVCHRKSEFLANSHCVFAVYIGFLKTDAVRVKQLSDGEYALSCQTVFVKDGKVGASGLLAGIVIKICETMRSEMEFRKCN